MSNSIERLYRLKVGNKNVVLDDNNRVITLRSGVYSPMDFDTAKKVANEIDLSIVEVYEIEKVYAETEKKVNSKIFE